MARKLKLLSISIDKYIKLFVKDTNWLTEKYKNKYFKEVAPFLGFNLRSLYLAVALAEGSYWDGRVTTSGLPALLDLPRSFQTRLDARNSWVEFIAKQ